MRILSSEFENNEFIPDKFSCDGEGVNPPLSFTEVPEDAKSLVLIVDDPDAPGGTFVHWVVYNIDPKTPDVEEGSTPKGGEEGLNSTKITGYTPPCPPSGTHRYFFKLYALDSTLNFNQVPQKEEVEKEMKNHILEEAELIGLYKREK